MTDWPEVVVYIGAPGFEPGTSPTRTVRATRLRHAPRGPIIPDGGVEALGGRRRYFGPEGCLWRRPMMRRLIPALVLVLMAVAPAAAQAYLPPGFVGISPQNTGTAEDYELVATGSF